MLKSERQQRRDYKKETKYIARDIKRATKFIERLGLEHGILPAKPGEATQYEIFYSGKALFVADFSYDPTDYSHLKIRRYLLDGRWVKCYIELAGFMGYYDIPPAILQVLANAGVPLERSKSGQKLSSY